MHHVCKMQQLYADLVYISRELFFLHFFSRRNNRKYGNKWVEKYRALETCYFASHFADRQVEKRYKLTALRGFMGTVSLNCNFRGLVRTKLSWLCRSD